MTILAIRSWSALLVVLLASSGAWAAEAERATYVGGGQYDCRGPSAQCAQIQQNNRQQQAREAQAYQQQQERADRYLQDERRRLDQQAERYRDRGR